MNEDRTDLSAMGDETMEARIVAWILGQASTFEAEELEKFCAENPEWRVYQRRMLALHGLLQEAIKEEQSAEWKLADEKRAKLEQALGTAELPENPNREKRTRHPRLLWQRIARIAAVVAIITIVAALASGPLLKQKRRAFMAAKYDVSFSPSLSVEDRRSSGESMDIVSRQESPPAAPLSPPPPPPDTPAVGVLFSQRSSASSLALAEGQAGPAGSEGNDLAQLSKETKNLQTASSAHAAPSPSVAKQRFREQGVTATEAAASSDPFSAPGDKGGDRDAIVVPTSSFTLPSVASGPELRAKGEAGNDSGGGVPMGAGGGFGGRGESDEKVTEAGSGKLSSDFAFFSDADVNGTPSDIDLGVQYHLSADQAPRHDVNGTPSDIDLGDLNAGMATSGETAAMPAGQVVNDLEKLKKSGLKLNNAKPDATADSAPEESSLLYGKDAETLDVELPKQDPMLPGALAANESLRRGSADSLERQTLKSRIDNIAEGQKLIVPTNAPQPIVDEAEFKDRELAAPAKQTPMLQQAPEIAAAQEAYSTFSLRVSDASFKLAQAALAKNQRPAPASIRVEEFYNAFDYGDPVPAANKPVACALEQSAHPFLPSRNLVRVSMRTAAAGRSAGQPLHLTVLIDNSGSMGREDRAAVLEKSVQELTTLLTAQDQVSVISFARTPRLLAEKIPGNEAARIRKVLTQTPSDGGTNLEEALKLSQQISTRNQVAGAQNRILLMTDGAANLGDANHDRLADAVKTMRQGGLAFDIIGIGTDGLNDSMLLELARNGNGRYYVVNSAADARENFARQLAGAFRPAAENVKVQVRFNPQRVGKYKLIGFEKDRLKTEDFRNDSVDAAELAAAEAGNAIYQVELLPEGSGDIGEISVRFRDTATSQMVENKWTINYDASAPAWDRGSPSIQLAGLSMLTAEKLRGGPMADMVRFRDMIAIRNAVRQHYRGNIRVGQLLEMIRQLE